MSRKKVWLIDSFEGIPPLRDETVAALELSPQEKEQDQDQDQEQEREREREKSPDVVSGIDPTHLWTPFEYRAGLSGAYRVYMWTESTGYKSIPHTPYSIPHTPCPIPLHSTLLPLKNHCHRELIVLLYQRCAIISIVSGCSMNGSCS